MDLVEYKFLDWLTIIWQFIPIKNKVLSKVGTYLPTIVVYFLLKFI